MAAETEKIKMQETQNTMPTSIITNSDPMGSIHLIEEAGDYVDPRSTVKGRVIDIIDPIVNKYGKAQSSARILKDDGTIMLISGFGARAKKLEVLQLGGIYIFTGKIKTLKTTYKGEERESTFMNL